jgi:hypothetical protein
VRFDATDRYWLVAYSNMVSGAGSLYLAFDPAPVLRELETRTETLKTLPEVPEYYDLDALRARLPGLEAAERDLRVILRGRCANGQHRSTNVWPS